MEFRDVIKRRRMVRRYTPEPIERESLDRIIEAAVRAPSAGFSQGQRFIVVTDAEIRADIAKAAGEDEYLDRGFDAWLSVAPVHVVLCVDPKVYHDRYGEPDKEGTDTWTVPYWWLDIGASFMAILYAAVDEGLDAGFLGGHAFKGIADVLDIPESVLVAGVVTIGHGIDESASLSVGRGRTDQADVVRSQGW